MTLASTHLSGVEVPAQSQANPQSADPAAESKLKKSAGEFESILLSSLWKSMKESFSDADGDSSTDPAKSTLDDWGIEIMSGAVGQAGGLGIGKMIVNQLEPALRAPAESTGFSGRKYSESNGPSDGSS